MNTFQILIAAVMLAGSAVLGQAENEPVETTLADEVSPTTEVPLSSSTAILETSTESLNITTAPGDGKLTTPSSIASSNETSTVVLDMSYTEGVSTSTEESVNTTASIGVEGSTIPTVNLTTILPNVTSSSFNNDSTTVGSIEVTADGSTTILPVVSGSSTEAGNSSTTPGLLTTSTTVPPLDKATSKKPKPHKIPSTTTTSPHHHHDNPKTPEAPPPTPASVPSSPVLFKFPKIKIDVPSVSISRKK